MSEKGDRAYELFLQGYNCSQAVFGTFCEELGIDFETAVRLSSGFGGGIGRMREVCGTLLGAIMAADMVYGYSDPKDVSSKKELYEKIRALAAQFRADNGSIICRELLGLERAEESAAPSERTPEYYRKRPCPMLCRYSAELFERFMAEDPKKEKG